MLLLMPSTQTFATTIIVPMVIVALFYFCISFVFVESHERTFDNFVPAVLMSVVGGVLIGGIIGLLIFVLGVK
jgi:hypothetical protein